jgi:membrane associated rhomboid family serine protease
MYSAPNGYFSERPGLWQAIVLPIRFLVGLWLIHATQQVIDRDWGEFGILPGYLVGLRGIVFAPLLHADWGHLFSNSLPFLIFATLINYFFPKVAIKAFAIIYLVTGVLVWLFASKSYHIGASYVVYGMASFIFFTGIFRRSLRSIVLSLLIMTFYSGLAAGVVPSADNLERHISWESHLMGAIVGALVAFFYRHDYERDELQTEEIAETRNEAFFDPQTFDKTKAERQQEAEEEARKAEENARKNQNPWDGWFTNGTF